MTGSSGTSGAHARYISQRGRGRKGGGGRVGSPAPKGGPGRRKLFEGPTNWYKVTVSFLISGYLRSQKLHHVC